MKLGAVFPQTEISSDPIAIKEFAQGAEQLGFDYILCYDHILGARADAYPEQKFIYTLEDNFHEPFVLYAFLAAVTSSIEFVTGILILPQRQTQLVAKQAAQLAVLSENRFRLGVGAGWNGAEAAAMGTDFHTRGRRMDEQCALLERLWTEPEVNFEGKYHSLKAVGIRPLPSKPVPLWMGGFAPPVLRRAARYAQGWMPATLPPDRLHQLLDQLSKELELQGRSLADFGIDARILWREPEAKKEENLRTWKDIRVTHLRCNTMGCGFESVDQHLDALDKFKRWIRGD